MTYIKLNTNFVTLNELSRILSAPVEEIEGCINLGLLHDKDEDNHSYTYYNKTSRKLRKYIKLIESGVAATTEEVAKIAKM